jgi:hypothetical protein
MGSTMDKKLTVSDEGDSPGLRLGRAEGEAYGAILQHMLQNVADVGALLESGDYQIAYASEKAEGMYVERDGRFDWDEPTDQNVHLEIVVRDRADGRFIPELDVSVTLIDAAGREIGTFRHPLLWHPYLYHYGRNWRIPSDGRYSLRVRFPAPHFRRHDKENGDRFSEGADVTFKDVRLKTGR